MSTARAVLPSHFGQSILKRLSESELWIERFAGGAVALILFAFSVWAWFASRGMRFWFDELLEITAAAAPTNHDVISFLRAGVDNNPPLSHFLIRASMSLFGNTELAARLPAFLGVVVMLLCLYIFVSRSLTRGYGLLAMMIIVCSPVRVFAYQARPYGLVLGFTALALVLYQQAVTGRKRVLCLIGLAICTACLSASHYYGFLVITAFLLGEIVRAWESRRLDWALLACSVAPPLLVLILLRDVIRQQRSQLNHYFAVGNLLSFNHGYELLDVDPLVYCMAFLSIAIVLSLFLTGRAVATAAPTGAKPYEVALGVGLLLLPITGAFCSQFITHAYLPRYFLPAALGLSLCACYVARQFSCAVPGLLFLLLLPLGLGFALEVLRVASHGPEGMPPGAELATATSPILFDTASSYMQVNHFYPELRSKTWIIADPAASLRYRKYDTDDKIMLGVASMGQAQAISLAAAVRRWPKFSLIPRAGDSVWALKCLMASGADIKVEQPFGDTNFVFDVAVAPENLPALDRCSMATSR